MSHPSQQQRMLKLKPILPQILRQLGIVILQPMRLIHYQNLPFNRRKFRKIICNKHLWSGDNHLDLPRLLPLAAPFFGHFVEVPLVECHIFNAIAGEGEFVFAGALTIIGASVVDNGCL